MCCVSQHAAFQEILSNWDENSYFYHLVQIIYLSVCCTTNTATYGMVRLFHILHHMFLIKYTFNHLAEVFH